MSPYVHVPVTVVAVFGDVPDFVIVWMLVDGQDEMGRIHGE